MTTQSIISTATIFVGEGNEINGTSADKSSGFDQVMEKSINKVNNRTGPGEKTKETSQEKPEQVPTNVDTNSVEDKATLKDGKPKMVNLTEDEEILAKIQVMLQTINEAVMMFFSVTEEELNQLMDEEGITSLDLISNDALRQLVLVSQGETDEISFLTDEVLTDSFNTLLHTVEIIKEDVGIDLSPKELEELLNQLPVEELTEDMEPGFNLEQFENYTEQLENHTEQLVNHPEQMEDHTEQLENHTEQLVNYKEQVPIKEEVPVQDNIRDFKVEGDVSQNTGQGNEDYENGSIKVLSFEEQADTSYDKQELNETDKWDTFVNNLAEAVKETRTEFTADTVQVTELREIANQIVEKVKVTIKPEQTSMELQLNPEHLGKINLSIHSKGGNMTAQFVVESEVVKEAIESQVQILKDALHEQGIKVEAVEVSVQSYEFRQNGQESENQKRHGNQKKAGQRITLEDALTMEEMPEKEPNDIILTGINGETVVNAGMQIDYTA